MTTQREGIKMTARPYPLSVLGRQRFALRLTHWIWFILGILEGLIGLRVLLRLLGANPAAPFAQFIYGLTDPFLFPFFGLTNAPAAGNLVLETYSLVAMFVYLLLTWTLLKVIELIAYPPDERSTASALDQD
jgi:uncharacterized protein YggT (Ycf19 family)